MRFLGDALRSTKAIADSLPPTAALTTRWRVSRGGVRGARPVCALRPCWTGVW